MKKSLIISIIILASTHTIHLMSDYSYTDNATFCYHNTSCISGFHCNNDLFGITQGSCVQNSPKGHSCVHNYQCASNKCPDYEYL